jgi:tetratricopeptide (TPR) repeat protein
MSFGRQVGQSLGLLVLAAAAAYGAGAEVDHARKLYNRTDFEQSLKILNSIADKDAAAYELMGRNYYMQSEFKKASEAFEKALAEQPANSQYALWLGRAHGRRAENATPFTAPSQATKARQYFEKAVALDPKNVEALADLFEYYLEAPGFLGGGMDKAERTAKQLAELEAGEGHWARAKMAEKRKDYALAEEQWRKAIEASPQQVGRLIDLARFLAKQGRMPEAEQNLAKADKLAPESAKLCFAKADIYIKHKVNLDVAKDLLKRYISNSNLTPDDPPKAQAEKLLRQVQGA